MDISFETPDVTNIFQSSSYKFETEKKEPKVKKLENELKITKDNFEKLRICNLILEIDQDSLTAKFVEIQSYLKLNHPKKAFEICSGIISRLKKVPEIKNDSEVLLPFIMLSAIIKDHEKKHQESLIFLNEGLLIDENHFFLLVLKSKCLFHLEKYTEAIEYGKKALDLDPDRFHPYLIIGEALRSLEKYTEAIEYYKKALDLDPDNLGIMKAIGITYSEMEDHQIAIDYFDKILKIDPNNMSVQTYRIVCLDNLVENLELLSIINEELKKDENNQDLLINKAILLNKMEKFKEAKECVDKILINNDLEILVDIIKHFLKNN